MERKRHHYVGTSSCKLLSFTLQFFICFIWIPYGEVFKHYKSKRSDINKRVRKSLNEKEDIAQYGIDAIFSAVVKELYRKGETKEQLLQKIGRYPISKEN